jgi:hypothetical protein
VVSDLLLVLGLRVDDDVGDEVEEDVFEELRESARHAAERSRGMVLDNWSVGALGVIPE